MLLGAQIYRLNASHNFNLEILFAAMFALRCYNRKRGESFRLNWEIRNLSSRDGHRSVQVHAWQWLARWGCSINWPDGNAACSCNTATADIWSWKNRLNSKITKIENIDKNDESISWGTKNKISFTIENVKKSIKFQNHKNWEHRQKRWINFVGDQNKISFAIENVKKSIKFQNQKNWEHRRRRWSIFLQPLKFHLHAKSILSFKSCREYWGIFQVAVAANFERASVRNLGTSTQIWDVMIRKS